MAKCKTRNNMEDNELFGERHEQEENGLYGRKHAELFDLHNVSKRFVIATETTDNIVKGRKYELIESESMGHYIIDESGEETYYYYLSLNVC
jgi:hypothetical protein